MAFRADQLAGANGNGRGEVDYGLARRHLVSEFRKGRLGRHELCDAHPELLRAARHAVPVPGQRCPICAEADVVFVSYVFGPRMPPNGKCITTGEELHKLAKGPAELHCYVVEVCTECGWNHLDKAFIVPGAGRRPSAR